MDVSAAGAINAAMQQKQIADASQIPIAMFKKAMDIQASNALQLIQSVPVQPSLATTGNLGTQLNVYA